MSVLKPYFYVTSASIGVFVFITAILYVRLVQKNREMYCGIESCGNLTEMHTVCMYEPSVDYQRCGNYCKVTKLSRSQEKELLDIMNDKRQYVYAGFSRTTRAANQSTVMTWDDELATLAQIWAYQCIISKDHCRDTRQMRVGQTVAFSASFDRKPVSLKDLVERWFRDAKLVDDRLIREYRNGHEGIADYTQAIWQRSELLGCGYIKCRGEHEQQDFYRNFLVCNYGPAGNVVGQPVYELQY